MKLKVFKWIIHQASRHKTSIIIFILTFCVFLPLIFRNNPHSPYYKYLASNKTKPSTRLERHQEENNFLYAIDKKYLASTTKSDFKKLSAWDSHSTYKVLVTIITTSREHHGSAYEESYQPFYLTQVIAEYTRIVLNREPTQLTDLAVVVCNVDYKYHKEAESLSSVVEVLQTGIFRGKAVDKFEVEKRDYVNCLNHSLARGADYILLAEDDAKPHSDLLEKLDHLFKHRLPRMNNNFGYIKLFHPSRLNGFITLDASRPLEWLGIAGLLEHVLTCFLCLSQIDRKIMWHKRVSRFAYFVLVLFAVGRINVLSLRSVSPHLYRLVRTPSCCTPALLFSPVGAEQMVKYLSSIECYRGFAKDSAMDAFTSVTGLRNWFFEPKLYDHIGVYTTLNFWAVDPAIVD